jgi:hypothetical protein
MSQLEHGVAAELGNGTAECDASMDEVEKISVETVPNGAKERTWYMGENGLWMKRRGSIWQCSRTWRLKNRNRSGPVPESLCSVQPESWF